MFKVNHGSLQTIPCSTEREMVSHVFEKVNARCKDILVKNTFISNIYGVYLPVTLHACRK